ncbi:response regulator [Porphyrobacter sp. AAP60]|uniref:response regulator n=1 Tax=Porphyrobacter sp. AAP60 TaxID=1523423 RepID=UPI0006B897D9|nr:response regulator [Porphyrobacter sp. AAP60]KPF65068.1 chemotaxis protein CheY [Porphyrobacter sp. AAP60]
MAPKEHHQVTILMVEDDLGHARLIEKNIRRAGVMNEVIHATDGTTALNHLKKGLAAEHRPFLVLLDLNLPDMSGTTILEHLKSDAGLRRFPVIVLTTTDDEREIQRCYDLGANVYITKPVDYEAFTTAIRQLGLFLAVMQVPGADDLT